MTEVPESHGCYVEKSFKVCCDDVKYLNFTDCVAHATLCSDEKQNEKINGREHQQ
jgi:hypothetical protein